MTDERDVPPDVSQAYRRLGADEPPPSLDDAIRAAARRSARPWTRRWGLPVSIAAVVVLSLTVTLRIADEQPDLTRPEARPDTRPEPRSQAQPEMAAGPAPEARAPAAPPVLAESAKPDVPRPRAAAPVPAADPKAFPAPPPPAAPEPARSVASAEAPAAELRRERAADVAAAGAAASRVEESSARDVASARSGTPAAPAMSARRAEAPAVAKLAQESPEQELERIARLRAEGKHEDADKALAEFRKRFPEFRIPEPMLRRVERR